MAIEELAALIVIDCSVAAVTVRATLLEVIPLWVALTLLDPMAEPVARPPTPILTIVGLDEVQVTELVRS